MDDEQSRFDAVNDASDKILAYLRQLSTDGMPSANISLALLYISASMIGSCADSLEDARLGVRLASDAMLKAAEGHFANKSRSERVN